MALISQELILNTSIGKGMRDTNLITLVEKGINEALDDSRGAVRDMCAHIAGAGGKRIRPQLVLYSGLAFSKVTAKMVHAAVAAELIHMASLVHDDIIDISELRRGKPTINKLWGNHAAVLCGDWLFAQAFRILSGRGLSGIMGYMVDAIQCMCQGELLQAANNGNLNTSVDAYFEQITMKTAKLLECSCMAGAAAGRANKEEIKALGDFGLNIGMAFQIIDDILDIRGNSGLMGKPKGEDIRQGIITLPVILLLQDERYGCTARELISKARLDEENLTALRDLLAKCGSLDKAYAIGGSYIDKALGNLDGLPDSESKGFLHELATSLRQREK